MNQAAAVEPTRRSMIQSALRVLRLIAVNLFIFMILAELASLAVVHWKKWPSSRPNYRVNHTQFWIESDPATGHWHPANGRFLHQDGCFSVEYSTNSYGARDVERSLHSARPRTIVLGDSMVEGLGLPSDQRLSNILESRTGREHLNFGIGGTGPLQYALLYKTKAAEFDHDVVLVGVLPDNDFHDMDVSYARVQGRGNLYRPYYANDLSVMYTGHFQPNLVDDHWDYVEDYLRAYLASYHVGQYIYNRLYWGAYRDYATPYSGYNDFTDVDLARLKRALQDIKSTADAHGARVAVILIPRAIDFKRLRESGQDRLGPLMEQWGQQAGIPVKDLLPEMEAASGGDYRSYFLLCDNHWSAHGSAVAADILLPWLAYKTTP
jgi:hypothetical protein